MGSWVNGVVVIDGRRAQESSCTQAPVRGVSFGNGDFIQSVGLDSAVSAGPCSRWALNC